MFRGLRIQLRIDVFLYGQKYGVLFPERQGFAYPCGSLFVACHTGSLAEKQEVVNYPNSISEYILSNEESYLENDSGTETLAKASSLVPK